MRVFRCVSAREITNLYKGKQDERKALIKGQNSHKYEQGVSYIHFFRYYQDCEYYLKYSTLASMNSLDCYVLYMVANIPNKILFKHIGYGIYDYKDENKVFNNQYVPLVEYAIPIQEFKNEYIVTVNNIVDYEYRNKSDLEHPKYLKLVKRLLEEYKQNEDKVMNYLKNNSLELLLQVEDDNRTENEIMDDKLKELCKVWKGFD